MKDLRNSLLQKLSSTSKEQILKSDFVCSVPKLKILINVYIYIFKKTAVIQPPFQKQ